MGKMKNLAIQLEDDWGELSEALEAMGDKDQKDDLSLQLGAVPDWYDTILYYVPKLMKAFDDLYLLADGLLKAVKAERSGETPAGLYVPSVAAPWPSTKAPMCEGKSK